MVPDLAEADDPAGTRKPPGLGGRLRDFASRIVAPMSRPAMAANADPRAVVFRCNICGARNSLATAAFDRESGACRCCGANVRFRSLIAVLAQRLLGGVAVLDEIEPRKDIKGVGMSDARCYASRLRAKFDYTNTFLHRRPRLDIVQPDRRWLGRQDFVISSDVFEHVAPPVQRAFDHLCALIAPGGVAVFSVPYVLAGETREHFPRLNQFSVRMDVDGDWVLDNITAGGERERFRGLVFHGGPGSTLEMRVFSLPALRRHFAAAGFVDLRIHDEQCMEHGIVVPHPWGLVLSARRAG